MLGRPISWGRRRIWSGFMISGLVNRSVWSGLMVVWFRGCVWFRFMVSWLVVCWFRRAVRSRSGKVSFSCGWMVWFGLSIMVRLLIGIWGEQMRFLFSYVITIACVVSILSNLLLGIKMIERNI